MKWKELFFLGKEAIRHTLKAVDAHGLHSPFSFSLYEEVCAKKKTYALFEVLEKERKSLLKNQTTLHFQDLGAGSKVRTQKTVSISSLAKTSASDPRKGAFLFRLVSALKPKVIVELGGCIGTGTAYISGGSTIDSQIYSFEGAKELADQAKIHLKNIGMQERVRHIIGPIEETFPSFLTTHQPDFIFIDANHTYEACMKYFSWIKERKHEALVCVWDDIRWSEGMYNAWKEIEADPEVTLSWDLFRIGIIFFHGKHSKQSYKIKCNWLGIL